jgi:hypothetical protein
MENEKVILVPNGLNTEFLAALIAQSENDQVIADQYIDNLLADQTETEMMIGQMIEDQNEDLGTEQMFDDQSEEWMIEQMIEDQMEESMIDQMIEEQMEQMMIDQMIENQMEDQMLDQMIEAQESYFSGGSVPDKRTDKWIAINKDFTSKSSEEVLGLLNDNLLCLIHSKFERTSKSGKTAYFSYLIKNKDLNDSLLPMGDFLCLGAESEHWVNWEYDNETIKEQHFLTAYHTNNNLFQFNRTFIYPIEYTFASLIPLHNYNPFHFSFRKLNFLKKNSVSTCGDKLSRLRIYDTKKRYIELSIYDFENNILKILLELNNSVSFIDFLIKINLSHAVKYLTKIKEDLTVKSNPSAKLTFRWITEYIQTILAQNLKYLPHSVKNNLKSEVNVFTEKYNSLVNEIEQLK